MVFSPTLTAARWYFGELAHEDLPSIAIQALELGHDGPMLRRLAGLTKPTSRDVRTAEVDSAFREMGISAPLEKREAQVILATEVARAVASGLQNPFDAATHIDIYICGWEDHSSELARIATLSKEARRAPRQQWQRLEKEIRAAFTSLLQSRE